MLRLIRFREREQGAVAAIVAMLFGFGVMLALAALTVDVGRINADRRQLQNGADAVALAVAQQCATTGTCDPTATNLGDLANANAADNATAIKRVDNQLPLLAPTTNPPYPAICGKAGNATGLLECDPAWIQSMSNLQECPSTPSSSKYVRVYAETDMKKADGTHDNILPYYFGAALTGIRGANQQACATVTWGTVGSVNAFPFTFSACEWSWATSSSGVYPPASEPVYPRGPPYDVNPAQASWQRVIELNDTKSALDCPNWQGHDLPGGFGWVDQISCAATISNDAWVAVDPGMGKGTANCKTEIAGTVGHTILIPVYDCIDTSLQRTPCVVPTPKVTPSNARYHITGFATFYVSGMDITGGLKIDPPFKQKCDSKCLYGWFLKDLLPVADVLGDSEDFGTVAMKLVG